MKLRQWQSECIQMALENFQEKQEHFLCLATPGAGKTVMASSLASNLFDLALIDMVICFSPSVVVSADFQTELERITMKRFDGLLGSSGISLTYQSMRTLDNNFWGLFQQYRVLVIFDEIHHCSGTDLEQANSWGEKIISHIQGRAAFSLALTGTPWRSDQLPIALARYCNEQNRVQCDYRYGLSTAISDNVCRTPLFTVIDNDQVHFRQSGTSNQYDSFKDLLERSDCTYQELLESQELIRFCLEQANSRLEQIRCLTPDAGGLIVATSITHAQNIMRILVCEFGEQVDIVTHKQDDALSILHDFKHGQRKWIISVGMISEGTNIPRLQVCCHLTRVKTELYFRQVLGRILRSRGQKKEYGYLFMPAEPTLVKYAQRVSQDIPETSVINSKVLKRSLKNSIQVPLGTKKSAYQSIRNVDLSLYATDSESNMGLKALQLTGEQKLVHPLSQSELSTNYINDLKITGAFRPKNFLCKPSQ